MKNLYLEYIKNLKSQQENSDNPIEKGAKDLGLSQNKLSKWQLKYLEKNQLY